MTRAALPTTAPTARGVDPRGIAGFLDAVEASPEIDPHSVMVLRHGDVVAQGWWSPYRPDDAQLLYSLSKTFTGTAAGLAAAEGLLDLDDLVLSHLPELEGAVSDPRSRSLRVRHVASMATGHLDEAFERAVALDPVDWVRGFLRLPPERDPGTVFAYSQPTTLTLGAIVQRVTGQLLSEYLRPRLLDPLGIGPVAWDRDPMGREVGFSGLHATTDAVARLGQLYLQRGMWQGRRLLPQEWVADASRVNVATPDEPNPDWRQGYGLQLWRSRHGYRGDGAYGQFCLVLPEQDAVVAVTAQTADLQQLLDAVWTHLLPALGGAGAAGPVPAGADTALAERLEQLRRLLSPGHPAPPGNPGSWDGAPFEPVPHASPRAPLQAVTLTSDEQGWQVVLRSGGADMTARLGVRDWSRSTPEPADGRGPLPLALSGAWVDESTLGFEVVALETPHSIQVTCDLRGRTLTSRWVTEPLGASSLGELRAPWR